ncbi:hypothetical protein I316_03913 [Kwoniella heveanensis BCC8398]|uniref:Cell division control protein 14 n=1 Tax=Kwoniella heveanensis BCC8398 TaxID=1296120 RepID=A0A1B9GTK4_9TREE|nr:hypothetical protein I316_03913 [Kwoniella heveanensis BCC8398]
MSRPKPQGHRKSQSTSALAFLASQPLPHGQSHSSYQIPSTSYSSSSSASSSKHRDEIRLKRSHLPSVEEGSSSASMTVLPGLNAPPSPAPPVTPTHHRSRSGVSIGILGTPSNEVMRPTKSTQTCDQDKGKMRCEKSSTSLGLDDWLNDLRSLRSSGRRRLAALKSLERMLVEACLDGGSRGTSRALEELMTHDLHQPLMSLLMRHTSTLSLRASSTAIASNDELAASLAPEMTIIVGMVQGLCLLSKGCKDVVGESWVMEMFIDLLLLLRAQPALGEEQKPIAYTIMELFFCILVDSPRNARTFEKLSGLEAVVRVLKGTGVTKEVRMKCIEFLYFYLLPEQSDAKRAVSSSSSSSSSSSNESQLYPPSPLSTSQNSLPSVRVADADARLTPSPELRKDHHLVDVDMPSFVPMTPRKPPQPNLGYLTPATRKSSVCTSTCSTPSLATVPASPRTSESSTARGLSAMLDEMDDSSAPTPRSNARSTRGSTEDIETSEVGLGLGLPKSSSGLVRSSTIQRDMSGQTAQNKSSSAVTDPFNLTANSQRSHSGSSGSSTVVPPARTMSRSSTQPFLNANGLPRQPSPVSSTGTMRRTSVRRVSKSPLVQSSLPEHEEAPSAVPRTPKIRHSRTQSHLSALSGDVPPPPVPVLPVIPPSAEKMSRTPSKPRAFPAELTRGLPPSASSPALSAASGHGQGLTPLGATKRITSDKRPPPSARKEVLGKDKLSVDDGKKKKDVKSVTEKKEMLGMWLGNVDQLVQGVEKVSFWGSIGNGARGGR